ncbi:auxin efflux carrier family protein [Marchantia polymorpha subsp. ruderalis]|uniref:Auxin efflux carrier component n=2 Tax=Marchantia polymorpha TaxID=3197 RepID=A0AAF6BF46_MARPO|nr:hypothetical protein MARPO_0027s0108 [Marchantia polymorpha]BBN10630.1 hypothetical protein Mp_5g05180 [Marchantia polymorpha subsp. ruderalis]|eukprot:PTQ43004.1 hypothetical protein MARPO_0027s0108 [Marchantia polymorpha]
MLTWSELWLLIQHIMPVYVIVLGSYVLNKWDIILPEHGPGLKSWVSTLGVPLYTFHLLAFSDPYQISFQIIGADVIQKVLALLLSGLWWKFSKSANIDGFIAFFMLATLPNTVLVGEAFLKPLYGEEIQGSLVTIIFLQSLIWYNICTVFYELRVVLQDLKEDSGQPQDVPKPELVLSSRRNPTSIPTNGEVLDTNHLPMDEDCEDLESDILERFRSSGQGVDDHLSRNSQNQDPSTHEIQQTLSSPGKCYLLDRGVDLHADAVERDDVGSQNAKIRFIIHKMLNRLKRVPLTYASILGFTYSMLAFKYHWEMPYPVRTSVELISQGCVGMALFLLGMQWARSGQDLLPGGWRALLYGMLVRFAVSPALMLIASLSVGLSANRPDLRFAVLQAVLPQGVVSFMLAKEYGVGVNLFSTAVVIQLLIFVPIAISYYYVLEQI